MEISEVMAAALTRAMKKASPNVVVTSALLAAEHSPLLNVDQLGQILDVKPATIGKRISTETFQIPVTRIGGAWYATAFDVAEYLERNKREFVG